VPTSGTITWGGSNVTKVIFGTTTVWEKVTDALTPGAPQALQSLSSARITVGETVGNYAVFAKKNDSSSDKTVQAYNSSLTQVAVADSTSAQIMNSVGVGAYALFRNLSTDGVLDVYNASLTHSNVACTAWGFNSDDVRVRNSSYGGFFVFGSFDVYNAALTLTTLSTSGVADHVGGVSTPTHMIIGGGNPANGGEPYYCWDTSLTMTEVNLYGAGSYNHWGDWGTGTPYYAILHEATSYSYMTYSMVIFPDLTVSLVSPNFCTRDYDGLPLGGTEPTTIRGDWYTGSAYEIGCNSIVGVWDHALTHTYYSGTTGIYWADQVGHWDYGTYPGCTFVGNTVIAAGGRIDYDNEYDYYYDMTAAVDAFTFS